MNVRVFGLILFLLFSPFILMGFHSLTIRLIRFLKIAISQQKLLLYCIIIVNIPILFISLLILGNGYRNFFEYLYIILTFNSIAYIYFHFFNMSETSRRIKILVGIKKGKIINIHDIQNYYSYEKSLSLRLGRLEKMSQIKMVDKNSYVLQGRLLYVVSYVMIFFRSLLGFSSKKIS